MWVGLGFHGGGQISATFYPTSDPSKNSFLSGSFWIITASAEEPPSRGSEMWQGCHNTSINNSWKACAVRADFSPLPGCGMPGVPLGKEISQFYLGKG